MRVYILALQNRIYFAEKLLEDIKNARIISKPFVDETVTEIATDVKRRIAGADIILAIIDEKSNNSVMFNTELQLALMESRKNRNKMLIPIILDDVAVPVTIEDTLYIKCNSESEEDLENLEIDELTDIKLIISLAVKVYENSRKNIVQIQNLFKKFVDFLYGYNNSQALESLTLKQKFYVFYEQNHKDLDDFSQSYYHKGLFNFYYPSTDLEYLKHKDTTELIEKIRKFDANGSKICSGYGIITTNIYTMFSIYLNS